jgi:hypothetical protein
VEEPREPECGGCGGTGGSLFFIPGGWGWADDLHDGRIGLCTGCGTADPRYREKFREHFGDIRFISDSDTASSEESLTQANH